MNYKQTNAFYDWLTYNSLSTGAIALWHALVAINNKAGWTEEFTVANLVLQSMTGLSRQGLDKARNMLAQKGLIEYKKGTSNKAGKYKMIWFECQKVDTAGAQKWAQQERKSSTLNKLNINIKEREIDARARDNTNREKSQENFDTEIAKINNKAFEFGMNGVTPEFLEDTQMRLEEGTEPELIIKALSIGATNAHGNAGAKCRYAIRILQAWAAEGIKTLAQWEAKNAPKARDKPITKTRAQEREEAFERAREEARRMLREEGVI